MRDPTTSAKARLRACFRQRRRALSAATHGVHATAVAEALAPRLGDGARIGAYMASDGEVDLTPVIELCRQRSLAVALPVIVADGLRFADYRPGEPLHRNRYGILEPASTADAVPTLVLTPLVAFDGQGHRLGRGGGYYDRYLATYPGAERIGIAHECQRATRLPAGPLDVPLAAVVTEFGWQALPAAD